ncbi:P-loop containing nucleoside triphosphate hydrolase protein [Guyanagaster necrorhizus]|uniref:P-loop containing nucleoside triphosphate hydrolase protein n=1 Tax=Guyanagaster necrorhizus TaxID=856835 RepID=A0A9P8AYZ6_9AGAR|nr:P-loop containing nucleoside triphosphate hydrolase protein [Guyanagaster necrorhizus MCA 3950]KAG7452751.1 P-loop containing nucleoside triphosphate hydrolase protein [Guyanagaster necrorhizus MCA 3950]
MLMLTARAGNYLTPDDVLFAPPEELARRCRISPLEAKRIVQILFQEDLCGIQSLKELVHEGEEKFTTGDEHLDGALGGGIRTGMLWEVVGERFVVFDPSSRTQVLFFLSAAGKTQLALQLSLLVQIPSRLGGLLGSTCYLTTSSVLPTARLLDILDAHPLLSPSLCGLHDVHTMSCPTIPVLIHVLSITLPQFVDSKLADSATKPVKLLVIDALGELFHTTDKTTTKTLVQRSRDIAQVSSLLHILSSKYNIAVVVLNEVVDAFDPEPVEANDDNILYSDQSRWFSCADSIHGEDRKEASLGLVWANQVNARIQLSRTSRRRYPQDSFAEKRLKLDDWSATGASTLTHSETDQATLIRRLSIIFSSVSSPASLDYIVGPAGISILPDDDRTPTVALQVSQRSLSTAGPSVLPLSTQISPLDVGCIENGNISESVTNIDCDIEGEPAFEWKPTNDDLLNSVVGLDASSDP